MQNIVFSIGYGNNKIGDFIDEIKRLDIKFVVDVRSNPYSKFNKDFNQEILKNILKKNNLNYVFLGNLIGGKPLDKTCYKNNKVCYDKLKDKDFFRRGLNRLINAYKKNIKIVLMCAEIDPRICHRSYLISQELLKKGIDVNHILNDKIITQTQLNKEKFGLFSDNFGF